jgi:hypothetical protein
MASIAGQFSRKMIAASSAFLACTLALQARLLVPFDI